MEKVGENYGNISAETGEDKQKAALDLYRCCFWNLNFARERQE
jgi:hypothetical protein